MNYRHAFHAGNFADLVKHAALLLMLRELTKSPEPLTVIDTHGGAGAYDLEGEMSARTREADEGVGRLMADAGAPEAFGLLKGAVARFTPAALRLYPGSPVLAAEALRRGDRLIVCEIHPDDQQSLRRSLAKYPNAKVVGGDGYAFVRENTPSGRLLVLIDPPFERPDDYERAASALGAILRKNRSATVAVWLPLKDLETFDAFLRRIDFAKGALVVEARLRPLLDPMKMNGCALVIANRTPGLEAPLEEACRWVVGSQGEARLWRLGGA